jgi:transcriptional regulator with GAF, ATPase, and Fis domain
MGNTAVSTSQQTLDNRAPEGAASGGPREPARGCERFFAPECPRGVPIVGRSAALRKTLETISLVAESNTSPILIVGETGTGKELAAQAVHTLRAGQPDNFVAVNCATLTANLLESELFGHVKGAFTGADQEKAGLFELAGVGTIFLDEISEMPSNLQAKLLRVLQERRFRKVGGTKTIACRATIIASSNRDLAKESRAGAFRHDLYYRLAVLPIEMPPLRAPERRPDIPLLADYFLELLRPAGRVAPSALAHESTELLLMHPWPGNVRELRNVMERALILEKGSQITPASLRLECTSTSQTPLASAAAPADDFSLETAERMFITRALQETGWQRTRAAALLGITRATLHAKLKRYRIAFPESSSGRLDDGFEPPQDSPAGRLGDLREARV